VSFHPTSGERRPLDPRVVSRERRASSTYDAPRRVTRHHITTTIVRIRDHVTVTRETAPTRHARRDSPSLYVRHIARRAAAADPRFLTSVRFRRSVASGVTRMRAPSISCTRGAIASSAPVPACSLDFVYRISILSILADNSLTENHLLFFERNVYIYP